METAESHVVTLRLTHRHKEQGGRLIEPVSQEIELEDEKVIPKYRERRKTITEKDR